MIMITEKLLKNCQAEAAFFLYGEIKVYVEPAQCLAHFMQDDRSDFWKTFICRMQVDSEAVFINFTAIHLSIKH
jgi:hypothetical protein